MTETTEKKIHHGRNVKRFREMLGMKQEALAIELGDDWNQKKISLLESKEEIEPDLLEQVAKALKVPGEAIKNFDEEKAINIIGNTVTTVNDNATGQLFQFNPIINPIEKWLEALEENKHLYEQKIELYERMLKDKTDMIEKLEQLLIQNK
jgi:transcriptional regulator with XRE-family HTH domain